MDTSNKELSKSEIWMWKKPLQLKTHRVPRHNGQRTYPREGQIMSRIKTCPYAQHLNKLKVTIPHLEGQFTNSLSVIQVRTSQNEDNIQAQDQHTPTKNTAVLAFTSDKYANAIHSWTEAAYQEPILLQGYKRRLDLPCAIFLSSTFLHNS